jgi:TetR/AcrR family transcriptional repressor of nem operon
LVAEQRPELGDEAAREYAISFYCEMVGALVLARAVGEAEPALADAILAAGRKALLAGTATDE